MVVKRTIIIGNPYHYYEYLLSLVVVMRTYINDTYVYLRDGKYLPILPVRTYRK